MAEAHGSRILTGQGAASQYLRLLRPRQWIKNSFVLAGFVFSNDWGREGLLSSALLATAAFCLISSAVYVLNDWVDRDLDQGHPEKRHRPLASGRVSTTGALILSSGVFGGGLILGFSISTAVGALLLTYLILNVLYSLKLQHFAILDVFLIASGFMIRILVGTVAIGIPPSNWLLVCSTMLALFIGFGKRYAELTMPETDTGGLRRPVLLQYTPELLSSLMTICGAAALVTYGLYTIDSVTVEMHGTGSLIYTLPVVTYGLFRYLFGVFRRNAGQDPAQDILEDWHLLGTVVVWIALVIALIAD